MAFVIGEVVVVGYAGSPVYAKFSGLIVSEHGAGLDLDPFVAFQGRKSAVGKFIRELEDVDLVYRDVSESGLCRVELCCSFIFDEV